MFVNIPECSSGLPANSKSIPMTPHAGNGGKTKSSGGFCNENPTKSTWLPQSAFGLIVSGEPRDRARIFLNDEKNNAKKETELERYEMEFGYKFMGYRRFPPTSYR